MIEGRPERLKSPHRLGRCRLKVRAEPSSREIARVKIVLCVGGKCWGCSSCNRALATSAMPHSRRQETQKAQTQLRCGACRGPGEDFFLKSRPEYEVAR